MTRRFGETGGAIAGTSVARLLASTRYQHDIIEVDRRCTFLRHPCSAFASQVSLAEGAINTNGSDHKIAINGLDTVAFFTEKKAVQGNESISYEWQGARWLFASPANRALFVANPDRYAPQWGGYCAVGIANGHVSKHVVKGSYDIQNGKLYLFAEARNGDFDQYRKEWYEKNGGPVSRIPQGTANWQVLKGKLDAGAVAPKLDDPPATQGVTPVAPGVAAPH
jgi:YHS domain-containing protein